MDAVKHIQAQHSTAQHLSLFQFSSSSLPPTVTATATATVTVAAAAAAAATSAMFSAAAQSHLPPPSSNRASRRRQRAVSDDAQKALKAKKQRSSFHQPDEAREAISLSPNSSIDPIPAITSPLAASASKQLAFRGPRRLTNTDARPDSFSLLVNPPFCVHSLISCPCA